MDAFGTVLLLFFRVCESQKPGITFTGDELRQIVSDIEAIVPDAAAARRLFEQLAQPVLKTAGHA